VDGVDCAARALVQQSAAAKNREWFKKIYAENGLGAAF
jgi:hypothetical protein